jgi:hypothetical protein
MVAINSGYERLMMMPIRRGRTLSRHLPMRKANTNSSQERRLREKTKETNQHHHHHHHLLGGSGSDISEFVSLQVIDVTPSLFLTFCAAHWFWFSLFTNLNSFAAAVGLLTIHYYSQCRQRGISLI